MCLDHLADFRLVAVGSTNPVIAAVRAVISRVAPGAEVEALLVSSAVPGLRTCAWAVIGSDGRQGTQETA
jgi:hypothetical protein